MDDVYVYVRDLRQQAKVPENGILSQTLQNDHKTKVIFFGFAPGQELSAHTDSGEPVYLLIPADSKFVLDALPLPRNAPQDCPYFFWNGCTSRRAVVGIAERTLGAVFKKSGVKNGHPHRFRHTLATRLLEQGATFEQVAEHSGEQPGGRSEALRQLVEGPAGEH